MLPYGYEGEMNIDKFKAEMGSTDLHPIASAGQEAWSNWVDEMTLLHVPEWNDAVRKLGIRRFGYRDMNEADRSAFAHSVDDRIRQKAAGMTSKKGKKR